MMRRPPLIFTLVLLLLCLLLAGCAPGDFQFSIRRVGAVDSAQDQYPDPATNTPPPYPIPTNTATPDPYLGPGTQPASPSLTPQPTSGLPAASVTATLQPTGAQPAPDLSATPAATRHPTRTFTPTPTLTPTIGPSATPTPALLVQAGTPLPLPLPVLSPANAGDASALARWQENNTVTDLDWTPDGRELAVARYDGISLYDVGSREVLRSLYPRGEGVVSLAFSPDGGWLATGSRVGSEQKGWGSNLQLWAGPLWRPLGPLYSTESGLTAIAFSPDSQILAAAFSRPEILREHSLAFFSVDTWTITRTVQTSAPLILAYSPDGALLASAPDRYAIQLQELRGDWELVRRYTSFTGAVNSLVFSPDGVEMASGHYDGTLRLWNVASGEVLWTGQAPGVVESLAFSPDGSLLATGGSYDDQSVRLWDVETGALLRTLSVHINGIENLLFSPDGQLLVSASYDGMVVLWGVRP